MSTQHERETSTTPCADVVLRLFEFVDDETEPLDRDRIQSHLDECRSCLAEYELDLLLKTLVRRACARQAAPAQLRAQILTRITSVTVIHRSEG